MLDHRAGRSWRPLEDTARSVQILRMQGPEWQSWRRGLDYYPEGGLIWLEVDTIIRQATRGQKSLDDFCRLFHGGESGPPKVVPYTFDDLVRTLNQVAPYDWARFLHARVSMTKTAWPVDSLERDGWRLVYDDRPNVFIHAGEETGKYVDASYSLGLVVKRDGEFKDVIYGSPAYAAGVGPGMKLVAVNGRAWSKEVLRDALRESKDGKQPIELLVENAKFFKTYSVACHEGIRNPHLQRIEGADVLGEILKPLSK
jgi:predicted metalloprotease with PDZ domain